MRLTRVVVALLLSTGGADLAAQCGALETGTGDAAAPPPAVPYVVSVAGSLQVDLDRDVSMISLVDNRNFDPPYAIVLRPQPGGEWSLTYAVGDGIVRPSRASRASTSLSGTLAQQVAHVWERSLATASNDPSSSCIGLDGKSYVFSAAGRQAHVWEAQDVVAMQLIALAATLKNVVVDAGSGGRDRSHFEATLARQMAGLEIELEHRQAKTGSHRS